MPVHVRLTVLLITAGSCLLATPVSSNAQPVASYTVTFEASWSALSHPDDFPASAHFSGLVGATHDSTATFWSPGAPATPGIRRMAESGDKSDLIAEVESAISAASAGSVLSGGGIGRSPGSVSLSFSAMEEYPLVTLVSMLAPSPDWFVGVSGVNLRPDGQWLDTLTVPLPVFDAGTDSGTRYSSPNQATSPPQAIGTLETGAFASNPTVGSFVFERTSTVSSDDPELPAVLVSPVFPNPTSGASRVEIRVAKPEGIRVVLTDVRGRIIWQETRTAGGALPSTTHLPTETLPAGLYFVRIMGREMLTSRSVVVVR